MHELILGGQRSGKSRCAELRAQHWLATPGHDAVLLATALPGDDEMRERIARHRHDRAESLPGLKVEEVPRELAQALYQHSAAQRLVVVDCLTLWLTNLIMPLQSTPSQGAPLDMPAWTLRRAALCRALQGAPGPVVLVSNEIGMGLAALSREARQFVDELGRLHQAVAELCPQVTLMVAGVEVPVKREAR